VVFLQKPIVVKFGINHITTLVRAAFVCGE
jgi:hypothetical protein